MPKQVVNGASLQCTMGTQTSSLRLIPLSISGEAATVATTMDFRPMVNVMPFGMCQTPSTPQVASATAAAQGVLTPQPCVPVVTAPWAPGSATLFYMNLTALNDMSKCTCTWGGVISIADPGQSNMDVP